MGSTKVVQGEVEERPSEDADFLIFKGLGQKIAVSSFDEQEEKAQLPGNAKLLAVSNTYGATFWSDGHGVYAARTADLVRVAQHSKDNGLQDEQNFITKVALDGVSILSLSPDNTVLLVACKSVLTAYSVHHFIEKGEAHVLAKVDVADIIRDLALCPGKPPGCLVVCRGGALQLATIDAGGTFRLTQISSDAVSVSWNPSGSHVAWASKAGAIHIRDKSLRGGYDIQAKLEHPYVQEPLEVDSIMWVRPDSLLLSLVGVDEDNRETECPLLMLHTSSGDFAQAEGSINEVAFDNVFSAIDADSAEGTSGPYMLGVYLDAWKMAIVVNRKSTDDHINLIGWKADDQAHPLLIQDDKWLPRVELTADDEDNCVSGLALDLTSSSVQLDDPRGDNMGEKLPPGPLLLYVTSEGKLSFYAMARLDEHPPIKLVTPLQSIPLPELPTLEQHESEGSAESAISSEDSEGSSVGDLTEDEEDERVAEILREIGQAPLKRTPSRKSTSEDSGITEEEVQSANEEASSHIPKALFPPVPSAPSSTPPVSETPPVPSDAPYPPLPKQALGNFSVSESSKMAPFADSIPKAPMPPVPDYTPGTSRGSKAVEEATKAPMPDGTAKDSKAAPAPFPPLPESSKTAPTAAFSQTSAKAPFPPVPDFTPGGKDKAGAKAPFPPVPDFTPGGKDKAGEDEKAGVKAPFPPVPDFTPGEKDQGSAKAPYPPVPDLAPGEKDKPSQTEKAGVKAPFPPVPDFTPGEKDKGGAKAPFPPMPDFTPGEKDKPRQVEKAGVKAPFPPVPDFTPGEKDKAGVKAPFPPVPDFTPGEKDKPSQGEKAGVKAPFPPVPDFTPGQKDKAGVEAPFPPVPDLTPGEKAMGSVKAPFPPVPDFTPGEKDKAGVKAPFPPVPDFTPGEKDKAGVKSLFPPAFTKPFAPALPKEEPNEAQTAGTSFGGLKLPPSEPVRTISLPEKGAPKPGHPSRSISSFGIAETKTPDTKAHAFNFSTTETPPLGGGLFGATKPQRTPPPVALGPPKTEETGPVRPPPAKPVGVQKGVETSAKARKEEEEGSELEVGFLKELDEVRAMSADLDTLLEPLQGGVKGDPPLARGRLEGLFKLTEGLKRECEALTQEIQNGREALGDLAAAGAKVEALQVLLSSRSEQLQDERYRSLWERKGLEPKLEMQRSKLQASEAQLKQQLADLQAHIMDLELRARTQAAVRPRSLGGARRKPAGVTPPKVKALSGQALYAAVNNQMAAAQDQAVRLSCLMELLNISPPSRKRHPPPMSPAAQTILSSLEDSPALSTPFSKPKAGPRQRLSYSPPETSKKEDMEAGYSTPRRSQRALQKAVPAITPARTSIKRGPVPETPKASTPTPTLRPRTTTPIRSSVDTPSRGPSLVKPAGGAGVREKKTEAKEKVGEPLKGDRETRDDTQPKPPQETLKPSANSQSAFLSGIVTPTDAFSAIAKHDKKPGDCFSGFGKSEGTSGNAFPGVSKIEGASEGAFSKSGGAFGGRLSAAGSGAALSGFSLFAKAASGTQLSSASGPATGLTPFSGTSAKPTFQSPPPVTFPAFADTSSKISQPSAAVKATELKFPVSSPTQSLTSVISTPKDQKLNEVTIGSPRQVAGSPSSGKRPSTSDSSEPEPGVPTSPPKVNRVPRKVVPRGKGTPSPSATPVPKAEEPPAFSLPPAAESTPKEPAKSASSPPPFPFAQSSSAPAFASPLSPTLGPSTTPFQKPSPFTFANFGAPATSQGNSNLQQSTPFGTPPPSTFAPLTAKPPPPATAPPVQTTPPPPAAAPEETMDEEVTSSSFGSGFGGLGLGSSAPTNTAKPNPFGGPFGAPAAAPPSLGVAPPGQLFKPSVFFAPSAQSGSAFGASTGGPFGGSAFGSTTGSAFGQSTFGTSSGSPFGSGAGAAPGAFGSPGQIGPGAQQPALGGVLGAFGQTRQLGSGIPGVAPAASFGTPSALGGGFGGFAAKPSGFGGAATGGGFAAAASGGAGFAAAQGGGFGGFASATGSAFGSPGGASGGFGGPPPDPRFTQMRK